MAVPAARWVAITALAGAGFALGAALAPRHTARAALTQAAKTVVERPVISSPGAPARPPALVARKRRGGADTGNLNYRTTPSPATVPTYSPPTTTPTTPRTTPQTTPTNTDTGTQPPPFQEHTGTGGSQ